MANAGGVAGPAFVSSELGILHRSKVNAGPHVLVATDRNLYAMALSGGRLLDVGEVVIKAPLGQAASTGARRRCASAASSSTSWRCSASMPNGSTTTSIRPAGRPMRTWRSPILTLSPRERRIREALDK